MHPIFHIVLLEPEIPNNTGNIGRTCVATGCALHLVKPLGFDTGEHALRRAGLDYWRRLGPVEYERWAEWARFRDSLPAVASAPRPRASWALSTKAARPVWDADLRPGDALVFGKETAGLPDAIIEEAGDRAICLPMLDGERSLNLATAVCAVVMEGLRQCVARGEIALDAHARFRVG